MHNPTGIQRDEECVLALILGWQRGEVGTVGMQRRDESCSPSDCVRMRLVKKERGEYSLRAEVLSHRCCALRAGLERRHRGRGKALGSGVAGRCTLDACEDSCPLSCLIWVQAGSRLQPTCSPSSSWPSCAWQPAGHVRLVASAARQSMHQPARRWALSCDQAGCSYVGAPRAGAACSNRMAAVTSPAAALDTDPAAGGLYVLPSRPVTGVGGGDSMVR